MRFKFLSVLLVLIVAAMAISPAFAMNWIQIGEGHYIDVDSIRSSTQYGSFTFDTQYLGNSAPLEEIDGKKVWTIKTNSYIDCRNGYAKTITYTALDGENKVVVRGKNVQKQWLNINTPGNKAYESYAFVCTDRYVNSYPRYNRFWWY